MAEAPWVFLNWNRPGRAVCGSLMYKGEHILDNSSGSGYWPGPALGLLSVLSVSLRNCKFTSQASIKYRITTCLMSICLGLALTTSCLSVRLYVALFVCLSFSLSICLFVCLPLALSVSLCISVYLSVCMSFLYSCVYVDLPLCMSLRLYVALFVCPSFSLSICLSARRSV